MTASKPGPDALALENARLFEQSQRRERELAAVLEVSRTIASSLDIHEVLGAVVDQLGAITEHTGASIMLTTDDAFEFVEARSVTGTTAQAGARIRFEVAPSLTAAIRAGETVIIDDVRADEPVAADYRAAIGSLGLQDQPPFNVVRSWMGVPLAVKDRVIGMLTISWTVPAYFTADHARIARVFADQAALAIENARLFDEAQRRARETEALFRSDEQLFRSLDLDEVLQALVDVAVELLGTEKTLVTIWDAERGRLIPRAWRNFSAGSIERFAGPEAHIVPDGRPHSIHVEESLVEEVSGAWREILEAEGVHRFTQVPLVSAAGEVLGVFATTHEQDRPPTEAQKRMLIALAERAVIALSNARLHERDRQLTAIEERQRLARELHDSVSQSLYGIALGARTARALIDRDPKSLQEPLDYILSLAEAGMAEMRALIFELRPESLETEGIVAALNKQIAATGARYDLEITANLCDEPVTTLERKETLYRIAQEALHNIVKHAHATKVQVTLQNAEGGLSLVVADNGVGFDTGGDFPGHLGLHSMRERAQGVGGDLFIESEAGRGTSITVRLPDESDSGGR